MNTNSVKLTFSNKVTRDQLIASLDRVLKFYGCIACGLNGRGVVLKGDPSPEFATFRDDLIKEKVGPLVNIEDAVMMG